MPFDKISPSQLFIMRIFTAVTVMGMGAVLAFLSGGYLLDDAPLAGRFDGATASIYFAIALLFGIFLASAGMMLLELTMKPPIKLSLGVPFVAANFQVATSVGIAASVLSVKHLLLPGDAPAGVIAVQALCLAGFALCFVFVVMTKLHYNFTENTGKALPKG